MNKTLFVVAAALVFNLVSCSKNDPPKHQLPSPVQSYRTAPMVPVDTNAVWGVMYTYRSGPYNTASGYSYSEAGWAWFYNATHTAYQSMDTVTFNGHGKYDLCYWPPNTPYPIYPLGLYHSDNSGDNGPCTTYSMDNSVNWVAVSDSNNDINIHYNYAGKYPSYSGIVPGSVSLANGLDLLLDSTTVSDADSVELRINTNDDPTIISKRYAANAGTVNMPLNGMAGATSINIQVMPYVIALPNFNGKKYAIIKQASVTTTATVLP